VSKAFSISKNTAAVDILLSKFRVTWSASLIHCSVNLWRARNPNWLALRKHLSLICLSTISKIRRLKWTSGLLGRCLRHSFGMPSIPQACSNCKEFSNFCNLLLWRFPNVVGAPTFPALTLSAVSLAWAVADSSKSYWFISRSSAKDPTIRISITDLPSHSNPLVPAYNGWRSPFCFPKFLHNTATATLGALSILNFLLFSLTSLTGILSNNWFLVFCSITSLLEICPLNDFWSSAQYLTYVQEIELHLPPTVSRQVCLGVWLASGAHDQIFVFCLTIAGFLMWGTAVTRGWVWNLLVQLILVLARAVTLLSKSRRTHGHILVSHLRLPQLGLTGPRIYIPQEQAGPVIPPGTAFRFVCSYDSRGYGGGVLARLLVSGSICLPISLTYVSPRRTKQKTVARPIVTLLRGTCQPSGCVDHRYDRSCVTVQ
jgi:hypothetical protein